MATALVSQLVTTVPRSFGALSAIFIAPGNTNLIGKRYETATAAIDENNVALR